MKCVLCFLLFQVTFVCCFQSKIEKENYEELDVTNLNRNLFSVTEVDSLSFNYKIDSITIYFAFDAECTCGYVAAIKNASLIQKHKEFSNCNIVFAFYGSANKRPVIEYNIEDLSLIYPTYFIDKSIIQTNIEIYNLISKEALFSYNGSIIEGGSILDDSKKLEQYLKLINSILADQLEL